MAGVGAATKTFAPGSKHPRAATDVWAMLVCYFVLTLGCTKIWFAIKVAKRLVDKIRFCFSRVIGWEDGLQNDLSCVRHKREVRLYYSRAIHG